MCVDVPKGMYKSITGTWSTKPMKCELCARGKVRKGCGGDSAGRCEDCATGTLKALAGSWDTKCVRSSECAGVSVSPLVDDVANRLANIVTRARHSSISILPTTPIKPIKQALLNVARTYIHSPRHDHP